MIDVSLLTDAQLREAWDKVEDGENLSDFEAAVIAEIEKRELDR